MFINKLLEKDPSTRSNAEEACCDPWIGNPSLGQPKLCQEKKEHLHSKSTIPSCSIKNQVRNKTLEFDSLCQNVGLNNLRTDQEQCSSYKNPHKNIAAFSSQTNSYVEEKGPCSESHISAKSHSTIAMPMKDASSQKNRPQKTYVCGDESTVSRQLIIPRSDRKILIDELFGTDTSTSQSTNDETFQVFKEKISTLDEQLRNNNREYQSINLDCFKGSKNIINIKTISLPSISKLTQQQIKNEGHEFVLTTYPNESTQDFLHLDRLFTASQTLKALGQEKKEPLWKDDSHKVNSWLNTQHKKKSMKREVR